MDSNLLAALAIVLLVAVIAAAVLARPRRSTPAQARSAQRAGSGAPAEVALLAREQPARKFEIVPLAAHEAQRFRMEWQALQARFAASPRLAVAEADLLARDVMIRHGYPMGDVDLGAAGLSLEQAVVVERFRTAHAIALRECRGEATPEELGHAIAHYRVLFDALLEAPRAVSRAQRSNVPAPAVRPLPQRAMAKDAASTKDRERRSER